MPIYKYNCRACGELFEDFRNIAEKEGRGKCLGCGSGRIERGQNLTAGCDCGCDCSLPHPETKG